MVELIREKLPAATEANKGLMQANGFEQGKNILNEEYDSKISAGVYSSTDNLNNMGTGILLALRGFQYTAHLYIIKHFNEFHTPLSKKEQERQGARCMNCGVPFCQSGILIKGMVTGCPLNNLIPEWNDATYTGNWDEAYNRLKKTNPFPEFTGRVCPHPCEVGCTCNLGGDPVNIKEKELSIIERAYESGLIKPEPPEIRTGKQSLS